MPGSAPVRSSLVIGLTLLMLGVVSTASKAGGPQPLQAGDQASSKVKAGSATADLPASNREQLALSRHLKGVGALFYGAWWCPACTRQKALFGQQGAAALPYVECDQVADDRQRCLAAKIEAFPTWVLQGKPRLVGVQSLEELKKWSGYAR